MWIKQPFGYPPVFKVGIFGGYISLTSNGAFIRFEGVGFQTKEKDRDKAKRLVEDLAEKHLSEALAELRQGKNARQTVPTHNPDFKFVATKKRKK